MKNTDLVLTTLSCVDTLKNNIEELTETLAKDFQPRGLSNSETHEAYSMHRHMIHHHLISTVNAHAKKEFDKSKNILDDMLSRMGITPDGHPGMTVEKYNDGILTFHKKQNKEGTTTLVVNLLTELARLGVEKSVVDEAMKRATKSKRGNVYYEISVV